MFVEEIFKMKRLEVNGAVRHIYDIRRQPFPVYLSPISFSIILTRRLSCVFQCVNQTFVWISYILVCVMCLFHSPVNGSLKTLFSRIRPCDNFPLSNKYTVFSCYKFSGTCWNGIIWPLNRANTVTQTNNDKSRSGLVAEILVSK
jgi:hypothetical protein